MTAAELMAHDALERLQRDNSDRAMWYRDMLRRAFIGSRECVDLRYVIALREHAQRCDPSTRFLIASDLVRRHH